MLRSPYRRAFSLGLIAVAASCGSGGGCSSGCTTMQPLPGGFPSASRLSNAATVRITDSGFDFLSKNGGSLAATLLAGSGMVNAQGVLTYDIPTNDLGTVLPLLCPRNGDTAGLSPTSAKECEAEVNVKGAALTITTASPNQLTVKGTLPVRVKKLGMKYGEYYSIQVGQNPCAGNFTYANIPVDIKIPVESEGNAARSGYSRIALDKAQVDLTVADEHIKVCDDSCSDAFSWLCSGVIDTVLGWANSTLNDTLKDQIKAALKDAACMAPNPNVSPSCPTGTSPDNADPKKATKCVYTGTQTCAPMLLGAEGRLDIGGMLSSYLPGTKSNLDFLVAASGALDPANKGGTLAMYGGAVSATTGSTCVTPVALPKWTAPTVPDDFKANQPTGWTGAAPHAGVGISRAYLDYAFTSLYNSGLFCMGVSTELSQSLSTGLLSLLAKSLKYLSFEGKGGAMALQTRPGAAPTVKLGNGTDIKTDPSLALTLNSLSIDFMVFSMDRYIRAFTLTADVTIPVNLSTKKSTSNPKGGLLPTIGDLQIVNPKVTNSELMLEDPTALASGLGAILSGVVGQFAGGAFSPIDLSSMLSSYGLSLTVPDGGIRKVGTGSNEFLGVFANLGVGTPIVAEVSTLATLRQKIVDPEAMTLVGMDRSRFPKLHIKVDTNAGGGQEVEHSYTIDNGSPSPWVRGSELVVTGDALYLQGSHKVSITSRIVGAPETEGTEPAVIPFVIDALPPDVSLTRKGEEFVLEATDFISPVDKLEGRMRIVEDEDAPLPAWSSWMPVSAMKTIAEKSGVRLEVEVRDEEGNVTALAEPLTPLVRGKADATLATNTGCGCTTVGNQPNAPIGLSSILGIASIFALGLRLRRSRSRAALAAASAATALSACGGSGGDTEATLPDAGTDVVVDTKPPTPDTTKPDTGPVRTGCGEDCTSECGPANGMGIVGAYTSLAKASDGTVWVAGYNEGDLVNSAPWGDLVVGKYDASKKEVDWKTVDGVPARASGTCPPNDPAGWRAGEDEAGDNVGLWTSLALDADNRPAVAYYDATNKALKYASYDGTAWKVHTVVKADQTDAGRYAKLMFAGGKPTIAYLVMEKGTGGTLRSRIQVAVGKSASPTAAADWTITNAATEDNLPCRDFVCDAKQKCIKETGKCQTPVTGCATACSSGGTPGSSEEACVTIDSKATCGTVVGSGWIDSYPNAYGDYISLASGKDGLVIAAYDRVHGNLLAMSESAGKWTSMIVDGETGSRPAKTAVDTGDVGIGAHLAVTTNGDWHIAYVNGITEALQYVKVTGGKTVGKVSVVDEGFASGGKPYSDGKHLVGDDAHITVESNGAVTIYYQDATAGWLRQAKGTSAAGGTMTWTLKTVVQPGKFAGFFPRPVPGESLVANFWRSTNTSTVEMMGNVAFVAP